MKKNYMDTKGFLKILEAIIAIIIVFGAVLILIPKAERNTGNLPPDLELIVGTILEDAQLDQDFRKCILGEPADDYPICIREEVNKVLGAGTIWEHAEKICVKKKDINGEIQEKCKFMNSNTPIECNSNCELTVDNIPKNRDVFTKSVSISVPDVTADPPLPNINLGEQNQLKLFFWEK